MTTFKEHDGTVEANTDALIVEKEYPILSKEFKRIQREQYELFCRKTQKYGTDNIAIGTQLATEKEVRLSLTGLWFRMNDKINRLKNLVVFGDTDKVGESVQDSFQDLSVYGVIAQIVANGKWGK